MSSEYFSKYLDEIGKYPLLSAEREIELCKIIQRGRGSSASAAEAQASEESRSELTRHNLRLVVSVASSFRDSIVTMEEKTFAGNVGLMEATKRFKGPELNARFATYAFYWIQPAIRDAIRRARFIRTPVRHGGVWQRLHQAPSYQDDQISQDVDKLHLETGIRANLIRRVLKYQCPVVSLDKTVLDNSGEGIEAVLPDDSETPATIFCKHEELVNLADALTTLTHRERVVVLHRFGMDGHEFKRLEQLAADFGVTRERVRQIGILALRKLRSHFKTVNECLYESDVPRSCTSNLKS
jgi:RNA polymerase nonessential primary-like sigma factor